MMKIKNNLLILFLVPIFFSCKQDKSNHNIESKGKISSDNKRIGEWSYYDSGELIAKGNYHKGLKKGEWNYRDTTYNSTKIIVWDIVATSDFKINIPEDWAHSINKKSAPLLLFQYESTSQANGNVILIEEVNKIENAVERLIADNSSSSDQYKLLSSESTVINGMKAHVVKQLLEIKNNEIYVEQYLVIMSGKIYTISFFTGQNDILTYGQLFSEVAYSFMKPT